MIATPTISRRHSLSSIADDENQAIGLVNRPSVASVISMGTFSAGGVFSRQLSAEEEAFHAEKTDLARAVMQKLNDSQAFDSANGEDGLEPPAADVSDIHFNRRKLANEVLAATEDYMFGMVDGGHDAGDSGADDARPTDKGPNEIAKALDEVLAERAAVHTTSAELKSLMRRNSNPEFKPIHEDVLPTPRTMEVTANLAHPYSGRFSRLVSSVSDVSQGLSEVGSTISGQYAVRRINSAASVRRASVIHDHMNHLLKNDGLGMALLTPPSHEKPVLKDPVGIRCVAHLHDKKWERLARAIRETIYDPDFYDDGTYGPMYVRLAIHGAATYDRSDGTGGLEGAAMRFKPEYSDAHNKFCKEIIKRQHEMIKTPHPWASYADIQCLCSYVALECANGPVIPFTPGRRDIAQPEKLNLEGRLQEDYKLEKNDFVYLNYRERGDSGRENEPVLCPASGKTSGGCPFMTKKMVFPGRVPGPEQGHLGKCCEPVTPEMEQKEWEAVAEEIRHIFCHRIGASERHTVALIAGGHSLGRCHPQISGYAGPWQSNPGYFNNVYCKKLLSEDWKLVDRNMEDCSGDLITGLKPYGMRRQYVNKSGKGDLMMLVSDMALLKDPTFGVWIRAYAQDGDLLKDDFKTAFKWVTELGFTPPQEKRGLAKLAFKLRKFRADALHWLGSHICGDSDFDADGESGSGGLAAEMPKVGKPFTMEDVKAHSSKTDCWVVINGQVCDLTKFMNTHPGGVQAVMDFAGKDASKEWNTIHSKNAIQAIAPETIIGHVVNSKS